MSTKEYNECIYKELAKDNKMAKTLFEIKKFYSLNAFADELSNFFEIGFVGDGLLTTANYVEWSELLDKAIQRVQMQSNQQMKYNALKKINLERSRLRSIKPERKDDEQEMLTDYDDQLVPENVWDVKIQDQTQPWLFSLECKLLWPMDCIFGKEFFTTMGKCLEKCQTLFHSYQIIIRLLHRDYFKDCKKNKYFDNNLNRKQRLLARNFLESLGVVYSIIRAYIENEIEQRSAKIISAKSIEEIVKLVGEWQTESENFLDSKTLSNGSYIHAAIEGLCALIEKFYEKEEKYRAFQNRQSLSLNTSMLPPTNFKQIESLSKKLNRIQRMLAVAAQAPFTVNSRSVVYCISVLLPSNIEPNEPYF